MKNIALSLSAGILAGLSVSAFLHLLQLAESTRDHSRWIVLGLPFAGFAMAWAYHHLGKNAGLGNHLILAEFHRRQESLPLRMVPLVFFSTIVTHLFGGSAGREGTAVQMGAVLADQLDRRLGLNELERRNLLSAGIAAGFGTAIGTPFAGMIFGMEVTQQGRLNYAAWLHCLLASFSGHLVGLLLMAPHTGFISPIIPPLTWSLLFMLIGVGLIFGLTARAFSRSLHYCAQAFAKLLPYPPVRALVGGFILVLLFWVEASFRYLGLGIPVIQEAMNEVLPWQDSVKKFFFTILTLAAGFKGGEFTPLVFIGASLGSFVAGVLSLPPSFLAALGFAAVFAGAANTPVACSLMVAELFGWQLLPLALLVCWVSSYVSGYRGIYENQLVLRSKFHHWQQVWARFRSGRE